MLSLRSGKVSGACSCCRIYSYILLDKWTGLNWALPCLLLGGSDRKHKLAYHQDTPPTNSTKPRVIMQHESGNALV